MRVGSIMSLLGTATGRVFAAFLPPKMFAFIESGVGRANVGDEADGQMTKRVQRDVLRSFRIDCSCYHRNWSFAHL